MRLFTTRALGCSGEQSLIPNTSKTKKKTEEAMAKKKQTKTGFQKKTQESETFSKLLLFCTFGLLWTGQCHWVEIRGSKPSLAKGKNKKIPKGRKNGKKFLAQVREQLKDAAEWKKKYPEGLPLKFFDGVFFRSFKEAQEAYNLLPKTAAFKNPAAVSKVPPVKVSGSDKTPATDLSNIDFSQVDSGDSDFDIDDLEVITEKTDDTAPQGKKAPSLASVTEPKVVPSKKGKPLFRKITGPRKGLTFLEPSERFQRKIGALIKGKKGYLATPALVQAIKTGTFKIKFNKSGNLVEITSANGKTKATIHLYFDKPELAKELRDAFAQKLAEKKVKKAELAKAKTTKPAKEEPAKAPAKKTPETAVQDKSSDKDSSGKGKDNSGKDDDLEELINID